MYREYRSRRQGEGQTTNLREQISESAREGGSRVRSIAEGMKMDENTVPDVFRNAPKFISPTVHAWLDVGVTGYFLGLGAWFASQRRKGPATLAFLNAGMVAGVSLLTDYQGTGDKPISFKMHGTLDGVQALLAGAGPALFGFPGERASAFFYGQASNEVAVLAFTDWDEGMQGREWARRAA